MQNKYCKKCNNTKPVSEFYKNKSSKDGFQHWCKNCQKEYSKQPHVKKRNIEAVIRYQKDNRLKVNGLTLETLDRLELIGVIPNFSLN